MHRPTLLAAGLMAVTLGIHLFAGGPEYNAPFQEVLPTPHLSSMAGVLWHAVSVALAVFAVALYRLALRPNPELKWTLAAIQIGWAALFLAYGASQLGTVWIMPQWVIFLALPALTFLPRRA